MLIHHSCVIFGFKAQALELKHEDAFEHAYEDERPTKWLLQYANSSLVKNGHGKKLSTILQLDAFTVDEGENTETS